jgi:hypothetical protein
VCEARQHHLSRDKRFVSYMDYSSIKFEAGTGTTHEHGEKTWRSSTTRVASFSYKKRSCAIVSVRHSPIINGRQSGLNLR